MAEVFSVVAMFIMFREVRLGFENRLCAPAAVSDRAPEEPCEGILYVSAVSPLRCGGCLAQALEASVVIAIMLQMCTRLGLIKCKRQGEPLFLGSGTPWCCHIGSQSCCACQGPTLAVMLQALSAASPI